MASTWGQGRMRLAASGGLGVKASRTCVAVDLGAESGRVVLGTFDGERLESHVIHRFQTRTKVIGARLQWNSADLLYQVQQGLQCSGSAAKIDSVGADAWGLDYGYLSAAGRRLADPVCYRDSRTSGCLELAERLVGRDRLYQDTGIQLMEINSIFQWLAESRSSGVPTGADRILMIPDLVHNYLSGAAVAEFSDVTTTGAYDVRGRRWATTLLSDLGIRTDLLPEVVDSGTVLGRLHSSLATGKNLRDTLVIAPASHDTASAVVATPLEEEADCYISSGTWSLVGVELPEPISGPAAQAANLSNEGGARGTIRLLGNVTGLWILQECRRQMARQGTDLDYHTLVELAAESPARTAIIDVNRPEFLRPGDMPARIRQYCRDTGQGIPADPGQLTRCILEGLALRYRVSVEQIGAVIGKPLKRIYVVGGGAQNSLLNQLTANLTGLPVHAGLVEAASTGNLLVQLMALGDLDGLTEARQVLRTSCRQTVYEPQDRALWQEHFERFALLTAAGPFGHEVAHV